jgi:hypothetical protein
VPLSLILLARAPIEGDIQRGRRENLYVDAMHYTAAFSQEIAQRLVLFLKERGLLSLLTCVPRRQDTKIPRGTVMDTTQFGTSTISLILRSPATLQMAYASCRLRP